SRDRLDHMAIALRADDPDGRAGRHPWPVRNYVDLLSIDACGAGRTKVGEGHPFMPDELVPALRRNVAELTRKLLAMEKPARAAILRKAFDELPSDESDNEYRGAYYVQGNEDVARSRHSAYQAEEDAYQEGEGTEDAGDAESRQNQCLYE